jgi:hypothetical protein
MAYVRYIFTMKQQGDVKQPKFAICFENIDITSISFNYATKVSLKGINKEGTCCWLGGYYEVFSYERAISNLVGTRRFFLHH